MCFMLHVCFMVQPLCTITPFYVSFLQFWRLKWINIIIIIFIIIIFIIIIIIIIIIYL